ncbi:MAG: hypothetical protein BroJett003_18900 [Planctomycetota bacterium]|nr:MAG: hypothetical protein BroJett003_18900 [Planctomycetota bacterium]
MFAIQDATEVEGGGINNDAGPIFALRPGKDEHPEYDINGWDHDLSPDAYALRSEGGSILAQA